MASKLLYNYLQGDTNLETAYKAADKALSDRIDALTGDDGAITSVAERVTTLESKVVLDEGYNTVAANIKGKVDAAVETLTNDKDTGVIDKLEARVATAEGDIDTLEGDVSTLKSDVTTLQGKVVLDDGYTTVKADIAGKIAEVTNAEGTGSVDKAIAAVQAQLDGQIETWFEKGVPTLSNAPASSWNANEKKNVHLGDLYYNLDTGFCYRFMLDGTTYKWELVKDSEVTKALSDAAAAQEAADEAQETADSKVMTFVGTVAPTASNTPASGWTTADDKTNHEGDLYFDSAKGYTYRYTKSGNNYSWVRIKDSDITAAKSAADAADAKAVAADAKADTKVAIAQGAANAGYLLYNDASGNVTTGLPKELHIAGPNNEHFVLTIGAKGALIVSEVTA